MSSDYQINIDAQAIQDSALEFNEIYEENEKLEAQKREQELLLQQQQEQAEAAKQQKVFSKIKEIEFRNRKW